MTQFETILCPVDPVAPSEIALQHAMALGDWIDARVTVLAVRPHGWRVGRVRVNGRTGSQPAEDASTFEQRIRQASGQSVHVQVTEGAVGREIVRAARDLRADLIVVGAGELGNIERLLFGSVTEHVLKHTSCPVLIVPAGAGSPPAPPAAPFERIVCVVDRSLESHRALAFALSLGRRHLAVVQALEDVSDEHPRPARQVNVAGARLWCVIEVVVPFGRAGGVLIKAAEARQASLMVIGTAGFRRPYGTAARHVIQNAPCPVLAVPRAGTRAEGRTRSTTPAHLRGQP